MRSELSRLGGIGFRSSTQPTKIDLRDWFDTKIETQRKRLLCAFCGYINFKAGRRKPEALPLPVFLALLLAYEITAPGLLLETKRGLKADFVRIFVVIIGDRSCGIISPQIGADKLQVQPFNQLVVNVQVAFDAEFIIVGDRIIFRLLGIPDITSDRQFVKGLAPWISPLTRFRRFKAHFRISPLVLSRAWDLMDVENDGPIGGQRKHLLWALLFLKTYMTESVLAKMVGVDEKTYRKWVWMMLWRLFSIEEMVVRT